MLFETVSYKGNLPFELSFLNVGAESKHCHREIEILLVLRGITHYQIYHTDYELNPGDLIIADIEDLHQIHDSSDDILMLSLHIDTGRFEQLYPDIRYMFFVCEECMENPSGNKQLLQSKLSLLKQKIACLAFDYMEEAPDTEKLMEGVNEVVSILVTHFQGFYMEDYQYKTSQEDLSSEDLQRLCRITRYIMLNYKEKISLDDVSEMEHLSSYYVSHLIKETLGFNFQNFVNAIRLEFAEKLLVFSNMTLMQISRECGFSSPNYFNKCFSAWHGKTPAQYRKEYTPCERSFRNSFDLKEALDLLSPYVNVSGKRRSKTQVLSVEPDFTSGHFAAFDCGSPRIILDSPASAVLWGCFYQKLQGFSSPEILFEEHAVQSGRDLEKTLAALAPFGQLSHVTAVSSAPGKMIRNGSPAAAFEDILLKKLRSVYLTGTSHAFFSLEGLKTPAYMAYEYLSQLEDPGISIQKDCILIRSHAFNAVLLLNTDTRMPLRTRISLKKLPMQMAIIQKEFRNEKSCRTLLEKLGNPAALSVHLYHELDRAAEAELQFFPPQSSLNVTLSPGSAVILEFIQN